MDNKIVKITDSELAFEKAKAEIQKIHSFEKAKEYHDKAEALLSFYKRQHKERHDVQNKIAELKILAAHRAGKILKEMKERGERHPGTKGQLRGKGTLEFPRETPGLKDLAISKKQAHVWQKIAELKEDEIEEYKSQVAAGKEDTKELTEAGVYRYVVQKEKEKKRQEKEERKKAVPNRAESYQLIHGDVAEVGAQIKDNSLDWIITDPPYPKEYLPLIKTLAAFSLRTLKPGGSLLCMIGQSYLPEVIRILSEHLTYQWCCAYMTLGAHTQVWQRKVMTGWKPLLWFVKGIYKGDWIHDVLKSLAREKDYHKWGQSETGMADIIDQFTYPEESICDPFLGGGTTGIIAVKMNRYFIGIDKDKKAIETTKKRLEEILE
ncbi:MAG: site-specific DNA-methyltransferase [Deltaproteobacteria bacterium]|nr:site-specific DNA-methyltransferase [Deltaproteobacteria bacterium]